MLLQIFEHELKKIAVIARCQYSETCRLLVAVYEPAVERFWQFIRAQLEDARLSEEDEHTFKILEGK